MDSVKTQIVTAALPHVVFDGWTSETLRKAAVELGLDPEVIEIYFPHGGIDAIAWHSRMGDTEMAEAIAELPLSAMKIPQKVKAAIMLRLRQQQHHREAIRKALGILSFPTYATESLQLLSTTVDTIWRSIGDTATDFNWYTKRMTLAGVYSATVLFWLNDESENLTETEAFLDRRLGNVHQLGKTRQKFQHYLQQFTSFF